MGSCDSIHIKDVSVEEAWARLTSETDTILIDVRTRAEWSFVGLPDLSNLGKQVVELRHAPRWQLALANRPAGEAVRALAWLGPEKAETALRTMKRKMPPGAFPSLLPSAVT